MISDSPKKYSADLQHMLIIVNPHATTVSKPLKNLVFHALRSKYQVDIVDTEDKNHAIELCRQAAKDNYDLVVALGGDGTVNEAANGLAGTDTPMAVLPGGSTNVFCRSLGIPNDIVIATERLLDMHGKLNLQKMDLGRVNDRFFTFGSGVGLDADSVRHIDKRPMLKSNARKPFYTYQVLKSFNEFRQASARLQVEAENKKPQIAVTTVVQNTMPYAYLGSHRLDVCQDVFLDSGTLSYASLTEARLVDLASISRGLFTKRPVGEHQQVNHGEGIKRLLVRSTTGENGEAPASFPLQVDGEYLGDFNEVVYTIHPSVLNIAV